MEDSQNKPKRISGAERTRAWRERQKAKASGMPEVESPALQERRKPNAAKVKANRHQVRKDARAPKRKAKEFIRLEAEQVTFQKALEFYIRAETRAAGEKESFVELLKLQRELNMRFDALTSEHVRLLDAHAENYQLIKRLQGRLEKAESALDRLKNSDKSD